MFIYWWKENNKINIRRLIFQFSFHLCLSLRDVCVCLCMCVNGKESGAWKISKWKISKELWVRSSVCALPLSLLMWKFMAFALKMPHNGKANRITRKKKFWFSVGRNEKCGLRLMMMMMCRWCEKCSTNGFFDWKWSFNVVFMENWSW